MIDTFNSVKSIKNFNKKDEILVFDLIIYLKKIYYFPLSIYGNYSQKCNNLFNLEENDIEWKNLEKHFERIQVDNQVIKLAIEETQNDIKLLIASLFGTYNANSYGIMNAFRFFRMYRSLKENKEELEYVSKKLQAINYVNYGKDFMVCANWPRIKKLLNRNIKDFKEISFRKKIYIPK